MSVGTIIVMAILLAALCVAFWRTALRLAAIAILTLMISGALVAFNTLHHMHHG